MQISHDDRDSPRGFTYNSGVGAWESRNRCTPRLQGDRPWRVTPGLDPHDAHQFIESSGHDAPHGRRTDRGSFIQIARAKNADGSPRIAPSKNEGDGKTQAKRRLSMSVINFWLDLSILVILVLLGWVSATLQLIFPAPTTAAGWTLWGLNYDQWRDVQFGILCLFAFGILVHVMLHWNWVCSVVATQIVRSKERPDEGTQTIYGVLTLIVLLHVIGIGVIIALFCVHRPPPPL